MAPDTDLLSDRLQSRLLPKYHLRKVITSSSAQLPSRPPSIQHARSLSSPRFLHHHSLLPARKISEPSSGPFIRQVIMFCMPATTHCGDLMFSRLTRTTGFSLFLLSPSQNLSTRFPTPIRAFSQAQQATWSPATPSPSAMVNAVETTSCFPPRSRNHRHEAIRRPRTPTSPPDVFDLLEVVTNVKDPEGEPQTSCSQVLCVLGQGLGTGTC